MVVVVVVVVVGLEVVVVVVLVPVVEVVGAAVVVVVVAKAFATAPIAPSMRPKPNLSWTFLSARGEEAARPIRAGKRRTRRISMPARKDPKILGLAALRGLYWL